MQCNLNNILTIKQIITHISALKAQLIIHWTVIAEAYHF